MAVRKTKAAVKKPIAKKVAAKKTTVKKAPAQKATAKKTAAITERYNKSQMLNEIAERTELSRKQVTAVIDELSELIERHVKKRACGEFVMPGLFKIQTVRKPATKARKGTNPFTGEETVFKAKPARTVIKVRPLKKLKEMAE